MKRSEIEEVIRSAIYHGRHFSPTRDLAVVRKCTNYLIEKGSIHVEEENKPRPYEDRGRSQADA